MFESPAACTARNCCPSVVRTATTATWAPSPAMPASAMGSATCLAATEPASLVTTLCSDTTIGQHLGLERREKLGHKFHCAKTGHTSG